MLLLTHNVVLNCHHGHLIFKHVTLVHRHKLATSHSPQLTATSQIQNAIIAWLKSTLKGSYSLVNVYSLDEKAAGNIRL